MIVKWIWATAAFLCVADVGFELGGQSDVWFLVVQIHYKFASYTGRLGLLSFIDVFAMLTLFSFA